jgi:hypothetical protein
MRTFKDDGVRSALAQRNRRCQAPNSTADYPDAHPIAA